MKTVVTVFGLLVFEFIILGIPGIQAQPPASTARVIPELRAFRVNPHPPEIDGRLDDTIWQREDIKYARKFIQRSPDEGEPASESTLVAVAYDESALYFAFWCYDSEPSKIRKQLVRRDRSSIADRVIIRLDPYHDHQSGYEFDISAANVQQDYRIYDEDCLDSNWDGVWESAVQMQPWGWSAEVRIPYYCLRFNEKTEHVWGIDFVRWIERHNESARWAFTPLAKGGFASNFGHLTGLVDIQPAHHLAIQPYMVADYRSQPGTMSDPDGRSGFGDMGVDVKYGISSDLTLDATVNPDFGQVEADEPVLNLSTFETQYSERRPFFIEGANLFETRYDLFYSRRIGRRPTGYPDDPEYYADSDRPSETTILGAAKLTGKLATGTNLAILTAVTDEEKGKYITTSGELREGIMETQAGYSVVRVKQDVLNNSSLGGMLTLASQDERHPAVTGGIDWRLYDHNSGWLLSGQTVFSRNDNENTGFGIDATLNKYSGKHIRGGIGLEIEDPNLNLNRLGYLNRNDWRGGWIWLQYRTTDDWWIIRNSYNNLNGYAAWNYAGDNIERGGNWNSYFEFINNWSASAGFNVSFDEWDDRETRGHDKWKKPTIYSWWVQIETDAARKLSFGLYPSGGHYREAPWCALGMSVNYRPASNLEFYIYSRYSRDYGQVWYVDNPDENTEVFADMNWDYISLSASASVMIHRNLSCQLSAEGILTSLDYYNYRPYLGGDQYGDSLMNFDYYDYNYTQLNSTLLIRWEYIPGSTLYLVWTRARPEADQTANNLALKRDFDRFFSAGAENIFLIKASYWWNI